MELGKNNTTWIGFFHQELHSISWHCGDIAVSPNYGNPKSRGVHSMFTHAQKRIWHDNISVNSPLCFATYNDPFSTYDTQNRMITSNTCILYTYDLCMNIYTYTLALNRHFMNVCSQGETTSANNINPPWPSKHLRGSLFLMNPHHRPLDELPYQ